VYRESTNNQNIKILTFGTFDVLHPGHVSYLTQAQNLGDELHVLVARDTTVENIKKRTPREPQSIRIKVIQEYFPDAIMHTGDPIHHMKILDIVQPDIIALGYDQNSFVEKLEEAITQKSLPTKIIRLKSFYPHMYKSTVFRTKNAPLKNMHGSKVSPKDMK
jgi:FAD synthetase